MLRKRKRIILIKLIKRITRRFEYIASFDMFPSPCPLYYRRSIGSQILVLGYNSYRIQYVGLLEQLFFYLIKNVIKYPIYLKTKLDILFISNIGLSIVYSRLYNTFKYISNARIKRYIIVSGISRKCILKRYIKCNILFYLTLQFL